jgi:phenylpropionate dioxygenase-like ring-hydroxylating dioxygenase large terminal subunit
MADFFRTPATFVKGSLTLAQEFFVSPEIFRTENERIFSVRWFCAGRQDRIPNAGDYFVLEAYGESIIVLRDKADTVRAFYNVCRHRGTRLREESDGRFTSSIQCPYHAWTYGLDGRLIGAPLMKDVEDFNREQYPLHALALQLWEGFIFLNMAESPEPFGQAFAPLADKFDGWNLPILKSARRIDYEVKANWKLMFQNYNECYHCPPVHPQLARISPSDSGENDLIHGPFIGGFMLIEGAQSLTSSGETCAIPVGQLRPEDHHRVYYYSISPNLLLSLHPDYVMFHTIWPQSPSHSLIHCEWLFHPDAFGRADFHPEDGIEFWDQTNRQDWHICELAQSGISSRAYRRSPYSPRESLPAAFDRHYLEVMRRE